MTIAQVFDFYQGKRESPCPVTDELMKAGLVQRGGGYLTVACVSELACPPSQWWHLMQYCLGKYEKHQENYRFPDSVSCCELLLWMVEVSGAYDAQELFLLKNEIFDIGVYKRGKISKHIREKYWKKVLDAVETYEQG